MLAGHTDPQVLDGTIVQVGAKELFVQFCEQDGSSLGSQSIRGQGLQYVKGQKFKFPEFTGLAALLHMSD